MSDPMKTAQAEAKADAKGTKPDYGVVTFDGVDYKIERKPNTLLLSELARTGTGDPEALSVFAEFFEVTLGTDTYRKFKRHVFRSEDVEADLMKVLQEILEKTSGRPTE